MQRLKLLGLALIAVFAASAAVTAVASAAVSFLPLASTSLSITFTAKSGAGLFETLGKKKVKCSSDKGSGEVTGETFGKFNIEFEGCEEPTLKVKCADLSQTSDNGKIKVLGELFHLRMGLTGQPLGVVGFLILPVHFLCSIILFEVTGCVAGEITPLDTLTSPILVDIKQTAGENTILSIDNETETGMENCDLSSKQGTGNTETAGEETHEELEKFLDGLNNEVLALVHA